MIQYFDQREILLEPSDVHHRSDVATVVIKGRFARVAIDIGTETATCRRCQSIVCDHAKRAEAALRRLLD